MGLKTDFIVIKNLVKPHKANGPTEFIENFYSSQAHVYDEFRAKLLSRRKEMIESINWSEISTWIDLGAGTGSNLEYVPNASALKKVKLVDLSADLLYIAQTRIERLQLKNVSLVNDDVCAFKNSKKVDLITFSYSLTMIPNWFKALENAYEMLKPGGTIAVVDFFVGRKWSEDPQGRHGFLKRTLWPIWFSYDNVFLNPDHLPYLKNKFKTIKCIENESSLPYVPFLKVPNYIFIGQKED